jgi:hypothetical protein
LALDKKTLIEYIILVGKTNKEIEMKNEVSVIEVNGRLVCRQRGIMKAPRAFRDYSKYSRKMKHQVREW